MGTNCPPPPPPLADLFLYSYKSEFLDNVIRSGHRRLSRSFSLCFRYINDFIVFNNKRFGPPNQLVKKANRSNVPANYLHLTFITDRSIQLYTKLFDKRDDSNLHIVIFPFLLSNIPSGHSYGVYISQLLRYVRCC